MNTSFIKERLRNLDLNPGDTKVIAVRPTKNAREVQLVFAEIIDRPSNRRALSDFNSSDERFENRNIQPVWLKAMLDDVEKLMPEAFDACKQAIEGQSYVALDIKNPTLNGKRLRVEISESHKPSKWEEENIVTSAKQDGEGNYLHRNYLAIFIKTDVVKGEPKHQFIHHNGKVELVDELDYATSEYQPQQLEDAVFDREKVSNQPELA